MYCLQIKLCFTSTFLLVCFSCWFSLYCFCIVELAQLLCCCKLPVLLLHSIALACQAFCFSLQFRLLFVLLLVHILLHCIVLILYHTFFSASFCTYLLSLYKNSPFYICSFCRLPHTQLCPFWPCWHVGIMVKSS